MPKNWMPQNNTLAYFQTSKTSANKTNKYLNQIISELKTYKYAYVPNEKIVREIKKIYPTIEVIKTGEMYEIIL